MAENENNLFKPNNQNIELIFFDNERNLRHENQCKISLNFLNKVLVVKTKNSSITAPYKWKFVPKNNILFVFANENCQDFALIFDGKEECKKTCNRICGNKKTKSSITRKMLEKHFLFPIFNEIVKSENSPLPRIIQKWLGNDENRMKEEYLRLINEKIVKVIPKKSKKNSQQKLNVFLRPAKSSQKNPEKVSENSVSDTIPLNISRKRPYSEVNENIENDLVSNINDENEVLFYEEETNEIPCKIQKLFFAIEHTVTVSRENFKPVNIKQKNRRGLIIFEEVERIHCHEFGWNQATQLFYCIGCRIKQKNYTAKMDLDERGEFCVKIEDKEHDCTPKLYLPEDYNELKIIKKHEYELLENCNNKCDKYLIIFDVNDKSQCHEYQWIKTSKRFSCPNCSAIATICYKDSEKEYVEVNSQHSCKMIEYNPEKYFEYNQFVIPPNFEIQTNIKDGKETLIVFDEKDRKLCHYYFKLKSSSPHLFTCRGCYLKRVTVVTAKIVQNLDGEDYVILSNSGHICSMIPYTPNIRQKEVILRGSEFKFMEKTITNQPKLFIFDKNDKNLCYTFSKWWSNLTKNEYFCTACSYLHKEKKIPQTSDGEEKFNGLFKVQLCQDSPDNEYYVRMMAEQKHICKPKEFKPENYEVDKIVKSPDFFFFQFKKKLHAAFYHPTNSKLCYQYSYSKSSKYFSCVSCFKNHHKHISAKLYKDENKNEIFKMKQREHDCTPVNIENLKKSGIKILKKSGLDLEEFKAKSNKKIDDNKIVQMPDFELRDTVTHQNGKLLTFSDKEDKTLYYEYSYSEARDRYLCRECRRKGIWVTSKLDIDEDGNPFLILNEKSHECNPVKYETGQKDAINKTTNYFICERTEKTKTLIVFTSEEKDLCYIYRQNNENLFHCSACLKAKKKTSAKLCSEKNGKDFVHLLKTDHICSPEKYILEDSDPKIINEPNFKLLNNKSGKPDSKLVIFDKNGNVYDYFLVKENIFKCNGCAIKKKQLTVKLCQKENSDEKYVQLSSTDHVCEPRKYDPENYKEKTVLYNNFVLQPTNCSNQKLIIFDENDKNYGYQFSFQKYCNTFICNGCKSRPVRVKLKINEEIGKEYIEITHKHSCQMLNFNKNRLELLRILNSQKKLMERNFSS